MGAMYLETSYGGATGVGGCHAPVVLQGNNQ